MFAVYLVGRCASTLAGFMEDLNTLFIMARAGAPVLCFTLSILGASFFHFFKLFVVFPILLLIGVFVIVLVFLRSQQTVLR